MAFPVSPTNGQITVVNNVAYQFSNVGNTWTRILSTANIISANTVSANTLIVNNSFSTTGFISAAGNVTGNYILGNGAFLTGVITSVANINSGNSNVAIASPGANVVIGVGGVANVAVFAPDGEYINGVLSVTGNTTLTGVSTGNISAGNLTTGGLISAGGNITGALFIGNGAGLVMSTLDVVAYAGEKFGGMRPANFLDIGGGASAQVMADGLSIILGDPDVKSVFVNVFGGITACDAVANGIVQALELLGPKATKPIVVRLDGNNVVEGRAILSAANHPLVEQAETMDGAASRAAELAAK